MKRIMLVGWCCAVAALLNAETVTTEGTVTTIDVPAGETYTHASALAAPITQYVKTGAGTLKLATAAASYKGTISVNAGFIDVAAVDAGGRGVIEVADGAAAIFSYESAGQNTTSVEATLQIVGAGPDGGGALRYTGSKYGDMIFRKIVLTADASIGGKRYGAAEIDMQGHVLTWVGTNLMSLGCAWKNFGGIVHNGTADICFQGGTFDATCTADKTITLVNTKGTMTFWNYGTAIPFKLVVNVDSQISANSGGGVSRNMWVGPVEVAAGKTLRLRTQNDACTLRMTGPITGAGSVRVVNPGITYLDNESNAWTGGTIVEGARLFVLSPTCLPGVAEGKVSFAGSGGEEYFIHMPTTPIAGASVQHAWTNEEIAFMQANVVRAAGRYAGLAIDVPAGETYTYSGDVVHNLGMCSVGTVRLTGDFTSTDPRSSIDVRAAGKVMLDNDGGETQPVRIFNVNGGGVLHVNRGSYELDGGNAMIRVGNGNRGVVWQDSGTSVNLEKNDTPYIGENIGSYGAWIMDGGHFEIRNNFNFAIGAGSFGGFFQKDGTFCMTNGTVVCGQQGEAVFYVSGGTNDQHSAKQGGMRFSMGQAYTTATNSLLKAFTVTGSNTLVRLDGLIMCHSDHPSTNLLNVSDGGEIEISRLYKNDYMVKVAGKADLSQYPAGSWASAPDASNSSTVHIPYSNGCFCVINANGGVILPSFGWGWNHIGDRCPPRDIDKIVLYEKGLVVDTSRCCNNDFSAFADHTFPHHLDPATGRGFDAIYLPTNNATFMAQKYIGPARVTISDASGWAASAFADFDKATGKLTGVVVTSRGCDYSESPTITVDSADGKTKYACTYTLSQNVCGGFTKRGAQMMYLCNVNNYTGVTCVESGTLVAMEQYSLPSNSHCLVKSGATLDLRRARTLKSIGGAGTITGGNVTITDGVVADPDALNSKKGISLGNNCTLTFNEGAKVSVSDLSKVDGGTSKWPLVTATKAIEGTPTIDRESLPPPYDVMFSPDRKTLYLTCPRGTAVIIR